MAFITVPYIQSVHRIIVEWRFRRTSDGEVIRGPEQGFDFVASAVVIFSADLNVLSFPSIKHAFSYNTVAAPSNKV